MIERLKGEMKNLYFYDLETYPNFFLATFKNVYSGNFYEFEISDRKSDSKLLYRFLTQKNIKLIGFNNINFDYPVLHNTVLKFIKNWTAKEIYKEAENVIASEYSSVRDKDIKIPQLDLFKIWHYDNKNKSTSLKWLEFAMRWENVEELPYKPGSFLNDEEKDNVITYCRNDINATEAFYNKSSKHIEIRKFYSKLEKINLINASEIKISKEIFSKHLAKEMKMSQWDVKQLRTPRDTVNIKDVIFDYLKFNDPSNKYSLDQFNKRIWYNPDKYNVKEDDSKQQIKFTVPYKNVIREYAEGGLHSFGKPGIYESNDEYVLVDVDFASFYPHICFRNDLHPEHIPPEVFNNLYEGFYKERKNYPKSDPRNYVLKIILNGSYGLSKDKYSFLYDPKWQLEICINGQLILTLLTEKVFDKIPDAKIMFENTDGAMYRVKRTSYKALIEACKEVEEIVNIPLEVQECKKLIARDVNNYINVISDSDIKFKGCFEIDRDYHKNHSKRIVGLALANYFINGKDVEKYIKNYLTFTKTEIAEYEHYGIYDFCIGSKLKRGSLLYTRSYDKSGIIEEETGVMNRYYVSNEGCELIKKMPPLEKNFLTSTDKHKLKTDQNQLNIFDFIEDDITIDPSERETNIESGWLCTIFNKFIEKDDYDINYDYYINECNKIIKAVENE